MSSRAVRRAQETPQSSVWRVPNTVIKRKTFRYLPLLTCVFVAALSLSLSGGRPSYAEGLCDNLRPDESRPGLAYRRRANSVRCEGFYVASDSSGGLDLLSLIWGRLNFSSVSRVLEIRLGAASSGSGQVPRIALRGRGLPDDLHYWMAADLGDGPFHIRLAEVIQPAGILPSEIGLYASSSSSEGERIYFPTRVFVDGRPLQDDDVLFAVVRPQSDIKNVSWRLHMRGEGSQGSNLTRIRDWVRAGTAVTITFKPPAQIGAFDLDVTYQGLHDNNVTTLPIHISTVF